MSTSASTASVEIPQPATLLIVEADTVFREFEARTLSDCGYRVLKASGMAEVLRLIDGSAAIQLLLTDAAAPHWFELRSVPWPEESRFLDLTVRIAEGEQHKMKVKTYASKTSTAT